MITYLRFVLTLNHILCVTGSITYKTI